MSWLKMVFRWEVSVLLSVTSSSLSLKLTHLQRKSFKCQFRSFRPVTLFSFFHFFFFFLSLFLITWLSERRPQRQCRSWFLSGVPGDVPPFSALKMSLPSRGGRLGEKKKKKTHPHPRTRRGRGASKHSERASKKNKQTKNQGKLNYRIINRKTVAW